MMIGRIASAPKRWYVLSTLLASSAVCVLFMPFALAHPEAAIARRLNADSWSVGTHPSWTWLDERLPDSLDWLDRRIVSLQAPQAPTADDLAMVRRLDHLERIRPPGTDAIPDDTLGAILALPRLTAFSAACPIDLATWSVLTTREQLEYLELKRLSVRPVGIGRLRNLYYLQLLDAAIDNAVLDGFLRLCRLTALDLDGCEITDERIAALARALPALRSLNLSRTRVTADGIAAFATAANLHAVMLDHVQLDQRAIAALAGCEKLTSISVARCGLTDATLPALLAMPALKTLTVSGCDIGPASLDAMRGSKLR